MAAAHAVTSLRYFLVSAAVALLSGCGPKPEWTAFVFPDASHIPGAMQVQTYTIGTFKTFEQCQEAAISRVRFLNSQAPAPTANEDGEEVVVEADYECGFQCTPRDEYGGMLVCKTDRK